MSKIYIYCAGPVSGCNDQQANIWRDHIEDSFRRVNPNIVCVSPVRCEQSNGRFFKADSSDHFHTPRGISNKNWFDTQRCDLILCYMPKNHFSLGTTIELGWAIGMRKPIVLVTNDEFVSDNPLVKHNVAYEVFTNEDLPLDNVVPAEVMDQVREIICGLCEVYT